MLRRTLPPIYAGQRPGGSALDHARQMRAATATRRRVVLAVAAAAGAVLGLLLSGWRLALVGLVLGAAAALWWQHRHDDARSWMRGARGEQRTARLLQPLERLGFVVLHDRQLPGSRANVDHLVVCPSGLVVVVDSKQWGRGRLVKSTGRSLRVGRVGGSKVIGAAAFERRRVAETLARDLGPDAPEVLAVLAIHGGRLPAWRTPTVDGIPLLRARRVRDWIQAAAGPDDPRHLGMVGLVGEACHRLFPPYQEPERPPLDVRRPA